jgi:hypothetical protein
VQVRSDAGAHVDRHEGVRDRVVEVAGDSQPLVGDAAPILLLALAPDPRVPLPFCLAQLAP